MKELKGNIFDTIGSDIDCICITTNGIVGATGLATMGAGTAGFAANRWPNIRSCLGSLLQKHGNRVFLLGTIIQDGSFKDPRIDKYNFEDILCMVCSVPTKNDFRYKSDINLIKQSTIQLVELVNHYKLNNIVLPRLGCGIGTGKLDWENEVKPIIKNSLDDRFTVFSFEGEN